MAIMKWRPLGWGLRPWRSFDELHREMDRLFEDFFGHPVRREALEERVWVPAVDVLDKKDKIVVRAELPSVEKKDVKVTVEGNTLIIKGERKAKEKVKGADYYACELSYGASSRSIYLPVKADSDKVSANFKNGVLEVTVPKAKGAEPKELKYPLSNSTGSSLVHILNQKQRNKGELKGRLMIRI